MFYSIHNLRSRRVPASLCGRDPDRLHLLGHRLGALVRRGGGAEGRDSPFNPDCCAPGYDVKLAAGVHHGRRHPSAILIPPSVMITRLLPGFRRAFRGVSSTCRRRCSRAFSCRSSTSSIVVGWAMNRPEKSRPPLPEEQTRVKVPAWINGVPSAFYSPNMFVAMLNGAGLRRRKGQGPGDRRPTPMTYGGHRAEFNHRAGAVPAHLPDAGDRVVGTSSSTSRPPPHPAPIEWPAANWAARVAAAAAETSGRPRGPDLPVSICGFWISAAVLGAMDRTLLLAHERRAF